MNVTNIIACLTCITQILNFLSSGIEQNADLEETNVHELITSNIDKGKKLFHRIGGKILKCAHDYSQKLVRY